MKNKLSLAVIIATKDRPDEVVRCVESLKKQTDLPDSLIIVDASKEKKLKFLLQKFLEDSPIELTYISSSPGLTHQRNVAIRLLKDDIALFLDDDVVLEPQYIEEIKKIFQKDKNGVVAGVTGKVTNLFHFHPVSVLLRKLFFLSEPGKGNIKCSGAHNPLSENCNKEMEIEWLPGFNQAYRKEIFMKHKFDEELSGYSYLEDVDFSYQISKESKLIFTPKARIQHLYKVAPSTRLDAYEKQKMYMINYFYFFRKHFPPRFDYYFCHFWSYIGQIARSLFLLRNFGAFMGTIAGILINVSGRNALVQNLTKKRFKG